MLEVSDLVRADDGPPQPQRPPLSCRLHLWHRWVRVHVDDQHLVRHVRALPATRHANHLRLPVP